MGDLTKNFSRHEFKCKHTGLPGQCEQVGPTPELLAILQEMRDDLGRPITIISGHRCPAHNANVGGVPSSQHLKGNAGDLRVKGMTPNEVQEYCLAKYQGRYGIGRYNTFTHIDARPGPHRWDERT